MAFGQVVLDPVQIAKRVSPTVVVIQGNTDSGTLLGSGFIISNDGKIVTNLHVVRDLKTATVHLADGQTFDSISVIATDQRRDLAIVQIAAFDVPYLTLGNSNSVTVGERVMVIGNPRGLEGTVTAGILSSVRDDDGHKILQTDAAVNPGNSGGPLVNSKGQAIGVVSFKLRSAEGLNFAVPINDVRGLLNNLRQPMSLEQMHQYLGAESNPAQQNDGPSLKETLDWLSEKIPLATAQFVHRGSSNSTRMVSDESVNLQGEVISLESCKAVFGYSIRMTPIDHPEWGSTGSYTFTVPLGALTSWLAAPAENEGDRNYQFVSGEQWGYRLFLGTKSNQILSVLSYGTRVTHTEAKSVNFLSIPFNDESLAQRVARAFHHASDLCHSNAEAF